MKWLSVSCDTLWQVSQQARSIWHRGVLMKEGGLLLEWLRHTAEGWGMGWRSLPFKHMKRGLLSALEEAKLSDKCAVPTFLSSRLFMWDLPSFFSYHQASSQIEIILVSGLSKRSDSYLFLEKMNAWDVEKRWRLWSFEVYFAWDRIFSPSTLCIWIVWHLVSGKKCPIDWSWTLIPISSIVLDWDMGLALKKIIFHGKPHKLINYYTVTSMSHGRATNRALQEHAGVP